MAYPLETLGMSPTQEEAPESSATAEQPPKAREWGQFELDAVCSLVCQHQHRPLVWRVKRSKRCVPRKFQDLNMDGLNLDDTFDPKDWALRLATKLNKTLHGVRDFKHDIPIEDVRDVLDFIEEEYKFVVKFIERQHTPFRVTRTKKYVFERMYNDFNDKLQAWTVKRWKRRGRGIRDCIVVNTKEPPKTHTRNLQTTTGPVENDQREKALTSLYARRGREIQKAPLPPPTPPPPPLPPPRRSWSPASTGERMRAHPDRYGTTPYGYGGPHFPPSAYATSYMPPTPEFHGFDELRRSIHPAGPRSANMMHTTSLYPLSLTFDRAGGYVYPNTPQRVNHDGNVFPDTPASPMTSPAYVPPSVRGSVSETDPSYETEQQYEQVQEHYHDDHALQFPDQGEGKDVQSSGPMRPVDRDEYLSGFRPGVDYSRLNY